MHVDLIETLRCPQPHADGWLVARADVVVERRIMQGTVGCPTCGAEWPIHEGALHLVAPVTARRASERRPLAVEQRDARADALRTAALLDLRDASGIVLLAGACALAADALAALTGVLVLAVNPPTGVAISHSRLFVADQLPLGVATVRGARLDASHGGVSWIASAWRSVALRGRLIAPVGCDVPASVRELARDEEEWVAEVRTTASGLVPLRRG